MGRAAARALDLLNRLAGRRDDGMALTLYDAVVARGRQPHWYIDGGVADTVDGRFDMIAAVLAMVLLRLEREPAGTALSVRLTERFVDDMDAQLRQIGIGDVMVGKHMGRMMSALGGRLGAYRAGIAGDGLAEALVRNLYRGEHPGAGALTHASGRLRMLHDALIDLSVADLAEGRLP